MTIYFVLPSLTPNPIFANDFSNRLNNDLSSFCDFVINIRSFAYANIFVSLLPIIRVGVLSSVVVISNINLNGFSLLNCLRLSIFSRQTRLDYIHLNFSVLTDTFIYMSVYV